MILKDVLEFLCHDGSSKESADTIQIVFSHNEWDDFEEVNAACPMLEPFWNCPVDSMGAEKSSLYHNLCVIRVSIDENVHVPPEGGING